MQRGSGVHLFPSIPTRAGGELGPLLPASPVRGDLDPLQIQLFP